LARTKAPCRKRPRGPPCEIFQRLGRRPRRQGIKIERAFRPGSARVATARGEKTQGGAEDRDRTTKEINTTCKKE